MLDAFSLMKPDHAMILYALILQVASRANASLKTKQTPAQMWSAKKATYVMVVSVLQLINLSAQLCNVLTMISV